ncbi:MAG TPA: hypothetical protein VN026_12560 [Bacteroidia bacterium]|jgi:hypothetical protein|nr:hypothetical protein [Bacteroidia bacterium]
MKTKKSVVLCAMIIVQTVKGQNNNHKIYLEAGLANGTQNTSYVSGVYGGFGVFLNQHSSIDIKAKELYNFSSTAIIGPITINYRYNFNCGLFVGGGFAHHHEVGHMTYMDHPMESAMGSAQGIFHRSGADLEVGYNFKPIYHKGFFSWIYPAVSITATQMFMDHGQNPLITANLGLRVGLKKMNKVN